MNRYRGLRADQRAEVLALLRAGRTSEEAAATIGKTPQALSRAAARDGELWAALEGLPEQVQLAARRGDFLAALTRTGGSRVDARRLLGMTNEIDRSWRDDDPGYAAAEDAVLAWLNSIEARPRLRVTDAMLDKAAALLEEGATVTEAARAVGVSASGLKKAASRHARLAGLFAGGRQPRRRGQPSGLTPQVEKQFREMWADVSLSGDEIARRMGVSRSTVTNWRRTLDLPYRDRARRSPTQPEG